MSVSHQKNKIKLRSIPNELNNCDKIIFFRKIFSKKYNIDIDNLAFIKLQNSQTNVCYLNDSIVYSLFATNKDIIHKLTITSTK